MKTILESAKKFIDADAYAVWRRSLSGSTTIWETTFEDGLSSGYKRQITEEGMLAPHLISGPLAVEDLRQSAVFKGRLDALENEGIRSLLSVPMQVRGKPEGAIVFYYRSPHRFAGTESRVVMTLATLASAALSAAEIHERETRLRLEAQAEERKANFLALLSERLSSSLDDATTFQGVVELAVPALADFVRADAIDESGATKRLCSRMREDAAFEAPDRFNPLFYTDHKEAKRSAALGFKAVLIERVTDTVLTEISRVPEDVPSLKELGITSIISLPIKQSRKPFVVLTFFTLASGRTYTKADLTLAEEIGRRIEIAVDNARLYQESKEAEAALRRSNAELKRANHDLNQFAYSASHDFQEPLRMIAVFSQLLGSRYAEHLDQEAQTYIDFAKEGAKRMEVLLKDLLAYMDVVNADCGRSELVDCGQLLQAAAAHLKDSIRESGAQIVCDKLPEVRMHAAHVAELFRNLLDNAIKYRSEESPVIRVSAERGDGCWKFSVKDNGIGIAPVYAEKIFGVFKRLHTATEYPGTGIGLAICQKIVERYEGRIWVEAEEGRGSTFYFAIPAEEENSAFTQNSEQPNKNLVSRGQSC